MRLVIEGWHDVRLEQVGPNGESTVTVLDLDELAESWAVAHGFDIPDVWRRGPRGTHVLEIVKKAR